VFYDDIIPNKKERKKEGMERKNERLDE